MKRTLCILPALFALISSSQAAEGTARARRSYEHAFELYLNGDFKRSLSEANDSIDENPNLILSYALRARLWDIMGEPELMQKDADRVLTKLGGSLATLNLDGLVAHGSMLLLKGLTEQALASFNAALQLNSEAPEALAGRARVWRAKGRHDQALADLDDLLKEPGHSLPLYLYNRANAYYELGQYDDALADLTAALRVNKGFFPAYGLLGAALAKKGDAKRALLAYNKATEINPEYGFGYLGRAALRLSQDDENEAFADFGQAIRVDAHDYAPYYNRAEAYWRRGNKDEALDDYRKASKAVSLSAEYAIKIGDRLRQLLLWKEAISAYTRAYVLAGGGEAGATVMSVSPLRREGSALSNPRPEGRRTVLRSKTTLSAVGVAALIRRAAAYDGFKDSNQALQDLSEAIERDPSSGEAWAARGLLYLRLGQDGQALVDLNQAVKIDPQNAAVRVARGSFYARTDRPRAALDEFNAAIESDPKNAEAFNNRGALHANVFNEPAKALSDILMAVELAPGDPNYLFNLAMMQLKSRDFFKAIETFGAALKNQGPPARILAHRADAYSQLGDHASALEDIQVALEKDPKYSPAYDILGTIRLRTHDYEQAVRDLNQALQLDGENVSALIHRGSAYGGLRSLKLALKDFRRATEIDPRSKEAFTYLCQARRLLKDPSAAARDCSRAIELDAYYAPAYLQRGLSALALRNADKTIEDVDAAAQLGLRRAEGLLAQAVAHAASKQYKQAHKDYIQALDLDAAIHTTEIGFAPGHGETEDFFNAITDLDPLMRGDVSQPYMFLVRGDALHNAEHWDKAIVEYTKAMELDGTVAEAYVGRGLCLMAQDAFDAAQQDFLRALELNPQDASTHVKLGTLLTLKRSYKEALQEFLTAIKLDPKNSEAYLRAGNVHYFQQHFARALENYELALKADPLSPAAYNGVGLGYFALKKYQDALENFSRAIALNPNSDRFYRNRASTFTNLRNFGNAAAEFRNASSLNTDPGLVEEYKKLIDEAEAQSASGKS